MSDITAFASDLRIEGFSQTTIREYVRRLGKLDEPIVTARAAKDHLARRRDIASVNDSIVELRALKAFSRWYAGEYGTNDELVSMPFPKGTKAAPGRIAREDSIGKLLSQLTKTPKALGENARDIALIELLRWTGCRRGEASRLNVEDVDFEKARIVFKDTKNREERHTPLHPELARALRRWIARRQRHRLAHENPALFLGRDGRLLSNGIGQAVERMCRENGIEHISPHQFRRAFAHSWASRGGNDDSLMAIAGWRSSAMPIAYRRELAKERAAADYDRLFSPDVETKLKIKPGPRRG